MMQQKSWRIPPPLHEKEVFARLTIPEWLIFAGVSAIVFFAFLRPMGLQGMPYLAIPAVTYILLRRNETDHGYINAIEMIRRYVRYFFQYAAGTDTFTLERSVRRREQQQAEIDSRDA